MWNAAAAAAGSRANDSSQQSLVDGIKAELGAAGGRPSIFKPAPPRPQPSSDPLDHRLVEEIECIRRHLDLLGSTLANDPVLVMRYCTQLQSIDLVNQLLGHIGAVIGCEDKAMAVDRISLTELRARLKRRPLGRL